MPPSVLFRPTLLSLLLLPSLGGCLTRKEVIRIAPDGQVAIALTYEGDARDLEQSVALPSENEGWRVSRSVRRRGDKDEHVFTASRDFPSRADLPSSYAAKNEPDASLFPEFPTSVRTEQRDDGLYVYFRRVYAPRPWAGVQYGYDLLNEAVKEFADKPIETLSHDERVRIGKAMVSAEVRKRIEFARQALKETHPHLPPEHWLPVRRAWLDSIDGVDWDALVEASMKLTEDERDEYFDDACQALYAEGHTTALKTLRDVAGYDAARISQFESAFARAERFHQITSDLRGHAFDVHVHMPGKIVAHNADEWSEDGGALWAFDGRAFRDRPYELLAISRVPPVEPADVRSERNEIRD